MADIESIAGGGSAGLLGALLGFFGLKSKVDRVDKDLQSHKDQVVYKGRFDEFKEANTRALDKLDKSVITMNETVNKIYRDMPKRESNGDKT